ncbi:hypothetical protein VTL71DRAFT_3349 [Oculimacula yallundae]|uniref:Uncharacterized protein n=1 Tax=Oculimacula yallundae TaxID=86028 RepID=A0ABR4C6X2_9HELO
MARTKPEARTGATSRSVHFCGGYRNFRSTTKRHSWSGTGCHIYGWPSSGGVIIRESDLVELQYLGFDPMDIPVTRHENQDDEDEFCRLLKRIGGKWWRSEKRYEEVQGDHPYQNSRRPNGEERREVYIGWPKRGGVLVLESDDSDNRYIPAEIGMLRMVTGMEERCELLSERFGANFYEDPVDYPGFGDLGKRDLDNDNGSEEEEEEEVVDYHLQRELEMLELERLERQRTRDSKCVCS